MRIRKEFRVESAHIVRNCTSHRCSHSIHGHSAVIEVFLESRYLDNAQMVYDFGLMKGNVKQFIDGMDHCYILCAKDNNEFRQFIKKSCDRWIELPFNPSAEMLSMFVMHYVKRILSNTKMANGEDCPECTGVRYHETTTGWAECDNFDLENLWNSHWEDEIIFSDGVMNDWGEELRNFIRSNEHMHNPTVEQQISLKPNFSAPDDDLKLPDDNDAEGFDAPTPSEDLTSTSNVLGSYFSSLVNGFNDLMRETQKLIDTYTYKSDK